MAPHAAITAAADAAAAADVVCVITAAHFSKTKKEENILPTNRPKFIPNAPRLEFFRSLRDVSTPILLLPSLLLPLLLPPESLIN